MEFKLLPNGWPKDLDESLYKVMATDLIRGASEILEYYDWSEISEVLKKYIEVSTNYRDRRSKIQKYKSGKRPRRADFEKREAFSKALRDFNSQNKLGREAVRKEEASLRENFEQEMNIIKSSLSPKLDGQRLWLIEMLGVIESSAIDYEEGRSDDAWHHLAWANRYQSYADQEKYSKIQKNAVRRDIHYELHQQKVNAANKSHEGLKLVRSEIIEEYQCGEYKSKRQASFFLAPKAIELSKSCNRPLIESNAQRTVYDWLLKSG